MNTKIHLVGIALIVVMALIALVASGRIHFSDPPAAADPRLAEYFIRVDAASWGMNCLKESSVSNVAPSPGAPLPLRINNVLRRVSSLCNGQSACTVRDDPSIIGDDPSPACLKDLAIEYRCRSLEPIRTVTAQGPVTLDCQLPAASPAASATPR